MVHIWIGMLFVAGWILCHKMPDGKTNIFGKAIKPFYQMSAGVWRGLHKYFEATNYCKRLKERLEVLHPADAGKDLVGQYVCYKGSIVLTLLFIATLISGILVYQERGDNALVDTIDRDSYWGTEKEEVLQLEAEGMEKEEVSVLVPEQKYSQEEIPQLLNEMADSLETIILEDNASLDSVTSDLNLVNTIPDTQVQVYWQLEPEDYMEYSGALIPDALTQEGAVVNLTATLSYEGQSLVHNFAVYVQKPELTQQEQFREDLLREISARNASSAGAESLELPDEVDGRKVSFFYPVQTYGYKLMAGLSICAVLLFFMKDEALQKELEARKKQMLLDYPEIVSKLTLLLGAGMTIRSALEKIAADYDKKRKEGSGRQRYAYDEILFVCREMQGGVREQTGLEVLGKRCQIPCYMKLCSLLQQNLKKGSKGMAQALGYEVSQAFEERKNIAKKFGEEAGTKLLFPMILMLMIVMVVLIVPAFLSF